VLFDLSGACNRTAEELSATAFVFDSSDGPQTLAGWWGNPGLVMPATPRVLLAANGVTFLIAGKPQFTTGPTPKQLLALASWKPNPLPGGAIIPVGMKCEGLWLLLQSYVHPMKNYIPNGEVVLHYADGSTDLVSLIPRSTLTATSSTSAGRACRWRSATWGRAASWTAPARLLMPTPCMSPLHATKSWLRRVARHLQ